MLTLGEPEWRATGIFCSVFETLIILVNLKLFQNKKYLEIILTKDVSDILGEKL